MGTETATCDRPNIETQVSLSYEPAQEISISSFLCHYATVEGHSVKCAHFPYTCSVFSKLREEVISAQRVSTGPTLFELAEKHSSFPNDIEIAAHRRVLGL